MNDKKFLTSLLIIIITGVLFRLWNFTPELGNDDQRWIITSQELGKPHVSDFPPVYYSRIIFRSMLAIWGLAAGLTLTTTPWLMFGLACITILMVALAGRVAFSPGVGLWAAAVYATHPLTVVHDILTLPDGLALTLLATSLYLFMKFVRCGQSVWLATCGFCIGLSFSAKEYFILAALPIAVCILSRVGPFRTRLRHALLFSALVAAGLSVDLSLHLWETGHPLMHFEGVSDYGEQVLARGDGGTGEGVQRVARAAMQRFDYLEWLLLDMGFVSGFLALWGTFAVVLGSRRSIYCLALTGMISVYCLFLFCAPANLDPFCFVEMQSRYLGILLPMIAIGSGISIAAVLDTLPLQSVRRGFLILIVFGLASNVMVPNDLGNPTFKRSRRQEFDGIKHILVHAQDKGVSELIFPDTEYGQVIPDRFYSLGVTISFYDATDTVSAHQFKDRLLNHPSSVLFVPRRGFNWPLVQALRRGEYQEGLETYEAHKPLISWLEGNRFSREDLKVPNSVFSAWTSWAGLVSREQQLVGWTYRQASGHDLPPVNVIPEVR